MNQKKDYLKITPMVISRLNDEELKMADNVLMNLAEQNEKESN